MYNTRNSSEELAPSAREQCVCVCVRERERKESESEREEGGRFSLSPLSLSLSLSSLARSFVALLLCRSSVCLFGIYLIDRKFEYARA